MTDADLLRLFLDREAAWVAALRRLQAVHQRQLGRKVSAIRWLSDKTGGTHSWLGYFWPSEGFWFGFGWNEGDWRPLIEGDRRLPASASMLLLREQMPAAWELRENGGFLRLWCPSATEDLEAAAEWFLARSHELHEFAVAG